MINPDVSVILFADLQPPIVANCGTTPLHWIETGATALAEAAEVLGIPVLFSVVPEDGGPAHAVAGLECHMTEANTYTRKLARPFMDERFAAALAATGRRTLIVAGYASEAATLFAAIDALEAGYTVVVALDAGGGASPRTEDAAMRRIERAGGTVTANVDILMSWAPDFTTPTGRATYDVMQRMIAARAAG